MTCSPASRLLAVLFLVTAISSGALAAPTPIPPVTTDSDLVLEARALRSHPDQTSHSLTTLQRRRGEYTSVDLIFEHRDGKEPSDVEISVEHRVDHSKRGNVVAAMRNAFTTGGSAEPKLTAEAEEIKKTVQKMDAKLAELHDLPKEEFQTEYRRLIDEYRPEIKRMLETADKSKVPKDVLAECKQRLFWFERDYPEQKQ
ncbi:hypothetical protein EV360DRAFT_75571 [Lentinula raphanica]|nr:hypothetical protein EV360DRAFT_75571 [Lentinula raphanica]